MAALRRLYGANPLHLLGVLAVLALAGAALAHLVDAGPLHRLALWLGGAIVVHDLVLYPLYTIADRAALAAGGRRLDPRTLNHIRMPTLLSALLLGLFFPLILGAAGSYERVTGVSTEVYLGRWLWLSGALFAGSALLYVVRRLRGARRA